MDKLNICVDIDGTITEPYCWLEFANNYFGKSLKPKDVTKYNIDEVLKIPREEYVEFYKTFGKSLHLKATIREGARQNLWTLSKSENIFYVTAREKIMEEVTKIWFDLNNVPMAELYLLGSHYKVDKAKDLNCDIFIEDKYENAIQLALSGFNVILMDCNYNREPLIPGITRVFNWNEAHKEIIKYKDATKKSKVIA